MGHAHDARALVADGQRGWCDISFGREANQF